MVQLPAAILRKTQKNQPISTIGISSGFHRRNSTTIVQFATYLSFAFAFTQSSKESSTTSDRPVFIALAPARSQPVPKSSNRTDIC